VAPHADPSLWGIEEEPEDDPLTVAEAARLKIEQEYWEKDLDMRMVFNFLKARFSSSAAPLSNPIELSSNPFSSLASQPAATSSSNDSPNATNRAALIRQHHPLAAIRRRFDRPHSGGITRRHVGSRTRTHTTTSSCASQSTKRSAGSRNYWDLTGSSAVGSAPGVYGEVGI
jgi:hypothetical protein